MNRTSSSVGLIRRVAVWTQQHSLGLALGFALLILMVSSIPATQMPKAPGLWRWDKLIHGTEYFLFGLLLFRALQYRSGIALSLFTIAGLTIVMGTSFGGMDELYQSTVPGRDSSIFDVLADMLGASFASIGSLVFNSRSKEYP